MRTKTRRLTHAALIGALYVILTHLQNMIFPDSATWVIQCRLSEALCTLAFFTPAAIPGLTIGCFLFNLTFAGALPLDFLVGSFATFLAAGSMHLTRNWRIFGIPGFGLMMPALFNALFVGWELTLYFGETTFTMATFVGNALCVAAGELIVMFTLGLLLWRILEKGSMGKRIFEDA